MMEYFLEARNSGKMPDADTIGRGSLNGHAPYTEIYLKIEGSTVRRATFTTFACGVSIACAAAVTDLLVGQSVESCELVTEAQIIAAVDGVPPEKQFCAAIVASAVRDAVNNWRMRGSPD
jgi:NifU-like protein involved in Fe-S cluster formation